MRCDMLETERLRIRKFCDADVDAIFGMRSDPEVMRFISQPQKEREASAAWMKMISSLVDSEGIGYFALEEKETGELAGWCGLWRVPETDEIEVGYAIARSKWRLGYATEAAREVVRYGFTKVGLGRIVAVAFPENEASIRVMRKLGMTYVTTGVFYGKQLVQYAVKREEWDQQESGI